ncbi:DASS family sodium-coupled anion symporter [Limibaculum sp. FT325]|uniref:SLC13 family permease n=1 Tax=Thermohalobaculum sediminis TaxID=2939436 RepID=UPI0020C12A89|nr:DASS family sodium-coupled anion symporter [Limibaculum sediminis]MCL5775432.1 DASS family sodium-coupled anion symporter [Limibaculum sediminis]
MSRLPSASCVVLGAAGLCLLAPFMLPAPEGLDAAGWRVVGVGLGMALLWLTGALPLVATAMIPLAAFPLSGVQGMASVSAAYAHPLIILFLGGFLLARAIETHGLHRWIALGLMRAIGCRPSGVIAGVMLATAFLSLWISNTAAAMIMAPIGAAIAASRAEDEGLAAALMLGIAFSATIGGMGSLIGTPPNALFAAYMADAHGRPIGFAEWAAMGLPTAAILLPLTWVMLARLAFRVDPRPLGISSAGVVRLDRAGRRVLWIAALAALGWMTRPLLARLLPGAEITDGGIAMLAALALFAGPDGRGGRLLDWDSAKALRWDVLILFGGGLALAQALDATGVAGWMAGGMTALAGLPLVVTVAALACVIVLVGELASNTAMAAIFLPVAGATAIGLGADPALVAAPVALAASVGFMLPIATPPNAIVFAHPAVTRGRMLRAGAPLDLIGAAVAVGVGWLIAPLVLG